MAAVPSWIASLSDPVLQAAMTSAAEAGSITEASMAQVFTDLANQLADNDATLSASQFDDLKTIAANLNVGQTASAYVTYLVDALVDGNAANAYWTGGESSAVALGNLKVGTTATQLNELIGQWFLGTNLPSDVVGMTGTPTFDITYSAVSAPLFAPSGPSMNDTNQGDLGDCYLLASLAEVAEQNPSIIESMITDNGNGTYGVCFYVDGSAQYVTVNNELPDGGTIFNTANGVNNSADDWAALIEKAYAQLQASGVVTGNIVNDGNSFSTIGDAGAPEYALEEITDASSISDFNADGSSWTLDQYTGALTPTGSVADLSTAAVLSALASDLAAGDDLVLSSNTNAYDSSGQETLVSDHAFSIYGFDTTTDELDVRNPWGTYPSQYWVTTFEVSLSALLADGDTITVDNIGSTGSQASASAGSQYQFFVSSSALNAVSTTNGDNLPPAIAGDFNLEVITEPTQSSYALPSSYQGIATFPGGSGKTLDLLAGNISVVDTGSSDTITAGPGNSSIGGAQFDTVTGGTGTQFIDGSAGKESIIGGSAGNETIWGGADDTIDGGSGANLTIGGVQDDTITGGMGTIFVNGTGGNQSITGGSAGNETIWGGAGDTIDGGTGADVVIGGVPGDIINGGSGTVFIDGTQGDQSITGGSAGNETIWGGAGDTIDGGAGANVTIGGAQDDTIDGGTGLELLSGWQGSQVIVGGSGVETIIGGVGDTVTGGTGTEFINATGGNQQVTDGTTGSETIWGGAGDTVVGGSGQALIGFGSGVEMFSDEGTAGGTDTISGFSQATGDRILLNGLDSATSVVATASTSNGNTTITFADGSQLTLLGVASINTSYFS